MSRLNAPLLLVGLIGAWLTVASPGQDKNDAARREATAAMRRAATFYRERAAKHGGYVYYYSLDLKQRLGEGVAGPDEIWVQMPATPAVGLAYIAAYRATQDAYYLDAVKETAKALMYGQLASGGWTNSIDFDPEGEHVAQYRNGKGRGRNYSTLDDGITQNALSFLMRADEACGFKDDAIHEGAKVALEALLLAQFPNGGFPQVWTGPSASQPIARAKYPDYDWRTENHVKEYWNFYTLNDDLVGYVSNTLLAGMEIYKDERCRTALTKLGDFLLLAQMPSPQPAWAQQYDYEMRPVWARKFEPPGVSGRESQDAIDTLMKVYRLTGDPKYLEPIPRALAYLKSSLLPDGQLARYYELQSNKPLYMTTKYELTYDDRRVPDHYGWKTASRIAELEQRLAAIKANRQADATSRVPTSEQRAREIVQQLDDQGRWISKFDGERLVGQPKFRQGDPYIASAVFSQNMEALAAYVGTK